MAQDTYVGSAVLTSGATLTTLQAGGLRGLIDLIIAANPALANPTVQATAVENGGGSSGGSLPAGNYFFSYTFVGPGGETTAGTSETTVTAVTATHIPRVTMPATPSGARCKNLYATVAGGLTGTGTLYATGITGTTFDCSFAAGTDPSLPAPPSANTTGITGVHAERLRALVSGQSDRPFNKLSEHITSYCQGDGTSLAEVKKMVIDYSDMFALLKKLMDDLGTLVSANPGTLAMTTAGRKRTFP